MNSYERFLNACKRLPVDRPPVWLMRQAGRYLPEYRLLRSQHDFIEMCKTPEIACEASLQPWQRYKMDAVIVFSDILFVPEAMGIKLSFKKEGGPRLSPILSREDDLSILKPVEAGASFDFVYKTIALLKKRLPKDLPLIGFSGAPWTLACYMTDNYKRPPLPVKALHQLLEMLTNVICDYVRLQQEAGADVIQIFDTWAGDLNKEEFKEFAAPYLKEIVDKGRKTAPFIVYSRKCSHILNELVETGADVVSIDPKTRIETAVKEIGEKAAIQGNLDPKILLTTPGFVRQETSRLLSKIKNRPGHIINLGHGVLKTTPPECVEAFVKTVTG